MRQSACQAEVSSYQPFLLCSGDVPPLPHKPMSENAKLTRGSIRGHLVSQTMPMIIGVAAIMSIGLVDAYFIGKLGSAELAAISFVFPITIALGSMGVGMMVGINSVVARALGEGDDEKAARRAALGMIFSIGSGLAVGIALYLALGPIFDLMQAPDHLVPIIEAYMRPFALAYPLQLAIMGINGTLRGQGEARKTSIVAVTYSAANWVLDPLLITGAFGFAGFGIAGAAYATFIGWSLGIIVGWRLLWRAPLRLEQANLRNCKKTEPLLAIVKVAAPASFSNSINPIGLAVLTALIASEGEAAVAGFGAAGRIQSFAVVPLLALSGAIGAIVGQNWGARKPERSREAMLLAGGFSVAYGLSIAIILSFGGGWFADIFTEDPAVMREFARYLQIAAWGYAGFGLLIVANGALNAVDKAGYALIQSAARVFLVMLPFAWILRGDWGADAIYAAELTANLLGGLLAAIIVWHVLRNRPAS